MASAVLMDDNSVLSELTEETKKSMPLLTPMTPVENKEITRACNIMGRRASLSDSQHLSSSRHNNHGASEDEEDTRMKYIPAHSSRRASMSGPTVEIRRQGLVQEFLVPNPQLLYQDDDARSNHSSSHQQHHHHHYGNSSSNHNKSRRPSVKGSATNAILLSVAGFTDDGDGYGTDNESVVSARSIRSMQRRASLQQKRRSSLSIQAVDPPCTPLSSSGSSTANSVSDLLAAATNMPPYLNTGIDDEEEEQDVVHHQPQNHRTMTQAPTMRRGSRRDGGVLYPTATTSSTNVPPDRGVQRYGTNDSMTMMEMQQPRRGSRHQQQQQQYETRQQRYQTSGMMPEAPPPQRGVQRYGTSDSVGMITMQKALGPPHMGAPAVPPHAKSRRGGRRGDPTGASNTNEQEKAQGQAQNIQAPTQRGVQRYGTNDSVTMQAMQVNPNNTGAMASPRRGKRGMIDVMYTTGGTQGQKCDSSLSDPESDPESDPDSPHGRPHSPQQQAPPPQRGVARYATNDSVTMQNMQVDPSARSPRRGKRPSAPGVYESNEYPRHQPSQQPQAPPQRGVARFSTNDSMEIQAMQVNSASHSPRRSPRRGKRHTAPGIAALSIDLDGDGAVGEQQSQQHHAPPPQRGVARYGTNDSVTMQSMQVSSGAQSPRRGKRGSVQGLSHLSQGHNDQEPQAQMAPPQRGVSRFATNDSVTMQAMQMDSAARSPKRGGKRNAVQVAPYQAEEDSESSVSYPESPQTPVLPQRGVARYATNDSVTMQSMQVDSNAHSPRRGKKPSAQAVFQGNQEQGHPAPSQRGVPRFATNDSVTMQAMQVDTGADAPRRGRRPGSQESLSTNDQETGNHIPPSDVATMGTAEEDDQNMVSVSGESEPERGVFRTNTADSMQLGVARQNGTTRRGGRRENRPADLNGEEPVNDEEAEEEVEYVYVEEEVTDDDENAKRMEDEKEEPERGVFRTNTADSMDLRAARENGTARRGRRREIERNAAEEDEVQHVYVDYGYDGEGPDAPMQSTNDNDMLSMVKNPQYYTNSQRQTRRGSTGVMPVEYTENVANVKRSFRRASTGQNCQLELCPMPVNSQSGRMGRRNSASSVFTARSEYSLRASYTPSVVSRQELRDMNASYHGGYGVSYLSSAPKRHDDSDSEEDVDYGYGESNNAAHMYGYGAAQPPRNEAGDFRRRGSESSRSSSVRRKSFSRRGSKQSKALKHTAALMSGKGRGQTSKGTRPGESDSEDSTIYGYGVSERGKNDEDSMSESEASMHSRSSRRSSRSRRNSVVILPDQAKTKVSGGSALLGLERDNDDGSDLMNNSAYLEYAIQPPPPISLLDSNKEKRYGTAVGAVQQPHQPRNETPAQKPTHILKSKDDSWGRATPFTTPHTSLTKEALDRNLKAAGIPMEQAIHKISYHHRGVELDSSDDSSTDAEGLYRDSNTLDGYDEYNQRPRRRDSLDKTCINMGELLEKRDKNDKKSKVPKFTPAVNCTNASDYIVRAFQARLRLGVTVIKHNRSRWSKSQQRDLILLPDGRTLSWKPVEGENDKGKRPKLDLLKCVEVRHAWSKDPDTRKKLGTAVLRNRCKDGSASKSFSLIFNKKRTLDMTAMSTDCCKLLMEGFSALCFRLQMDRLSNDDHDHEQSDMDDKSHCNEGTRSVITDDDWASTVYESTTSRTQTNTVSASTANSPWGL